MPSTLTNLAPMYIRLGKDTDAILERNQSYAPMQVLQWERGKADILYISTGVMTNRVKIAAETIGIRYDLLHIPSIKPIDLGILEFCNRVRLIVTAEEGIRNGGLGSAILELMSDNGIYTPMLRLGLPDAFPHHYGEQDDLLQTYGLQPEQIAHRVKEAYERL